VALCDACKQTQDAQRQDDRQSNKLRFIAIDGEGQPCECQQCGCEQFTLAGDEICACDHKSIEHKHKYVLLRYGTEDPYENPEGITWGEAFAYLYHHFSNNRDAAHVGYYLGYDFIQILKSLPRDKAWKLLSKPGRESRKRTQPDARGNRVSQPWPVQAWNNGIEWEFDILGSKRLKIRPRVRNHYIKKCYPNSLSLKTCEPSKPWLFVCDAGPFFQQSFMKTLDPAKWIDDPPCTQAEYDSIMTGKARRAVAVLDNDMRRYNRLENEIMSRVMDRLNAAFADMDIRLKRSQWFGPGQVAQALLRLYDAPKGQDLARTIPDGALGHIIESYFAGWFEITVHGHILGTTWEYDINSAYPYQCTTLPCLGVRDDQDFTPHGQWSHQERMRKRVPLPALPEGKYRMVHAYAEGSNPYIGAMLHREWASNTLLRPQITSGWYWQRELEAAKRAGLIDAITVDEWHDLEPCRDCLPPLRKLSNLYLKRQAVGKDTARGKAYKLGFNSPYGKLAQSIGEPVFSNPVWASLITSGCRTQILDAIATHPEGVSAVVMVATDAVYFRSQHPNLVISKSLGDWGVEQKCNLTLFKPGTYWDDKTREHIRNGDAPIFKSRGVSAKDFGDSIGQIDAQFAAWELGRKVMWPAVTFPVSFPMVTGLQALQRNQWQLAGTLEPGKENTQSSNPESKRRGLYYDGGIWRSKPYKYGRKQVPQSQALYMGIDIHESQPYDKRFGIAAEVDEDRRDPAPGGITSDGTYGSTIYEALGLE
jgi:hypothetical protein